MPPIQLKLPPQRLPPPRQRLMPQSHRHLSPHHLLQRRKREKTTLQPNPNRPPAPVVAVVVWPAKTEGSNPPPHPRQPSPSPPQHPRQNLRPRLQPRTHNPQRRPTAQALRKTPNAISRAAVVTATATVAKTTPITLHMPTTFRPQPKKTATPPNAPIPMGLNRKANHNRLHSLNPVKSTTKTIFWGLSTASESWK